MSLPPCPPLLVFADDWGRHPSSCQHLIRQLLPRYSVHWINTIGMRKPRLDRASLRRAFEKFRHWFRGQHPAVEVVPQNLSVISPLMWPYFTHRYDRWLNRKLLLRTLNALIDSLPEAPVAITTLPIVAELMGDLLVKRWVYYCVDDFGRWPGLDQPTLDRLEGMLVRRADVIVAVSETLRDRLRQLGRESELLTHGIDTDHWKKDDGILPAELTGLETPLVVFWGVVDQRMDTAFVARLTADLERGTILLVGPCDNPDPQLLSLPRVRYHGPLPYADLPALARAASVLVMPYADREVTRMMQPLKLKEYLATGRPVVVRRLPSTTEWGDCLDQAETPEEFSRLVRLRLQEGLPEIQRLARQRLAGETWAEKARQLERWAIPTAGKIDVRNTDSVGGCQLGSWHEQ